jgi:aryl-alcohol dehydrogenase-like predicted oxidoreductase
LEALRSVAAEHAATPAQIALAWTIRQGSVIAIPGARRVHQVEENAAAAGIELTADQVDRLERAASSISLPRRMEWARLANAAYRAVAYGVSELRRRA